MKHKILVSKEKTPTTFNSLVKLINHVRIEHSSSDTADIKVIIDKEYNIKFGVYDFETRDHLVEFDSEKDFLMFTLKWS